MSKTRTVTTPDNTSSDITIFSTKLGTGGFGTVNLGKSPSNTLLAVKSIDPSQDGKDLEEDCKKEIAIMTHLISSPNTVQLYGSTFTQKAIILLR